MRHIPGVVPIGAQNATALVLQDEMTRRLSKLKTMADWGAMLEELSGSKGIALLIVACAPTQVLWRQTAGAQVPVHFLWAAYSNPRPGEADARIGTRDFGPLRDFDRWPTQDDLEGYFDQ